MHETTRGWFTFRRNQLEITNEPWYNSLDTQHKQKDISLLRTIINTTHPITVIKSLILMVRLECKQVKQFIFEGWAISIVSIILHHSFSAKAMTILRRRKSTKEEDAVGFLVLDEEQERVIAMKMFTTWRWGESKAHTGGCRRLRAFLGYHHEGPVQELLCVQPGVRGHPRIVSSAHAEGFPQPHGWQDGLQIITILHFKPGQVQYHSPFFHMPRACPLY